MFLCFFRGMKWWKRCWFMQKGAHSATPNLEYLLVRQHHLLRHGLRAQAVVVASSCISVDRSSCSIAKLRLRVYLANGSITEADSYSMLTGSLMPAIGQRIFIRCLPADLSVVLLADY